MLSISDQDSHEPISRLNSSSARRHTPSLVAEAAERLSPDQLHHMPPDYEQADTAIVSHVDDSIDTPLSMFHAPTRADSMCEAKNARSISPHRATRWKYVGMIIGFLFAGRYANACG